MAFAEWNINLNDTAQQEYEHKHFVEHTINFFYVSRDIVVKICVNYVRHVLEGLHSPAIVITVVAVIFCEVSNSPHFIKNF